MGDVVTYLGSNRNHYFGNLMRICPVDCSLCGNAVCSVEGCAMQDTWPISLCEQCGEVHFTLICIACETAGVHGSADFRNAEKVPLGKNATERKPAKNNTSLLTNNL